LKSNGEEYHLKSLRDDQREVALYILDAVKKYATRSRDFKPIRLTLMGMAGSGKTVLVKTLISTVRKMFGFRRSALVCAPTGAAAFNAGGITIHKMCGFNSQNTTNMDISDREKEKLMNEILDTVLLFLDERSMISLHVLGKAECAISQSTRHGHFSHQSWGGLPIVVLIGDDMQLPSVSPGTSHIQVGPVEERSKHTFTQIEMRGQHVFLEAAEDVMVLNTIKRQDESEKDYKHALDGLRHDRVSGKDFKYLSTFNLNMGWTPQELAIARKDAVYAFCTNDLVAQKNSELLQMESSETNPVAAIQCCYPVTRDGSGKAIVSHFRGMDVPKSTLICVGARVSIRNKNFNPRWGLFNGGVGTVLEIVFKKGESPNEGHLPSYVIVDFPGYCGPAWDSNNPTVRVTCIELFV